ncbi:N5-glutamine methyltransferase family protein [Euzebya rosea]|uniref:N5-glutamine methyltransferase family protein n=1 Tax=Euzebya rosea TaxID=2052804 RepID=UPI000D3E4286|nr:HemK family protein methyltransferase [Euzebya rosea]
MTDHADTDAAAGPVTTPTRAEVAERLRAAGVPSPDADARWLLEGFPSDPAGLADAIRRRAAREPLQLILGTAPFRWIEVQVAAGVFVPRPETEVLAGLAIDRLSDGAIVIEPCTGTGAISCAIAHETGASRIVATDINPRAVELAKRNARPHPQVEVHHASLFAGVDPALLGAVDVIVCNPPYLDPAQMAGVDPEVRDHDPYEALVGGESGWEVIADLVAAAPHWLKPGGWIVIEDDPSRVDQTAQALAHHVGPSSIEPDLTGRDRFAMARRA